MYTYHSYNVPKRILITGGAGFIGSHLTGRLLEDGHQVLCLDNYFTGRKENIIRFLPNPRFEMVRHDITEPLLVEVDWIFNLACPASPIHYQYNPVKTTKVNVLGALNVLGLAKRVRARVLQASTSEVYGDPEIHPQREEYWGHVNPIGKRSCYDEGKRVAETLFFDYMRQNEVDIKVIRIFNTYGPRMRSDDGRVVSNFIEAGPSRQADYDLRRGQSDKVLLLRRRYDRGHDPDDGLRGGARREARRLHKTPSFRFSRTH